LSGQVWVGTAKGPTVIYNPTNIFTGSNFDAQQILIQQDGNTQILLGTETINCIEVDGANRKWMGTETSGVYLLSEDGQQEIAHFTQDNSPLPSNTIFDIEIDGKSGEVFFATANGLLSYRGTATNSSANFDNVKVFPNPVRPGYDGVIAVNGLSKDSDIKVTDIAGNIVNVIKSEGGQAIWDGKNLKGQRVKSGIYLFMCSSEDGSNKVAAKVMFVE
jgi:ligand-binding sensor domain-containing protein